MEMKYMRKKIILAAAFMLTASPMLANAGPAWTFGPADEGVLQLDYKAQFQLASRDIGSGSDNGDATTTANFRRNRLAFMGAWDKLYSIYVQTEFVEDANLGTLSVNDSMSRGSDFSLIDAQLRFAFDNGMKLRVGKFKHNLTRENLEDCYQPLTLDRSLFMHTPYVATRDRGMALWGNLMEDKLQYRFDIMEGRESGDDAPDSSFRMTGRVHLSLWEPESGYGYRGTYLGKKKVLTVGASYQVEPDMVYSNTVTGASADYTAWSADLFMEYPLAGGSALTVSAAMVDISLDDAYQSGNAESTATGLNGEKNGGYVKLGYLFGGDRPLQLFARAEGWSFAELDGVYDQEVSFNAVGLNYYIKGQDLKLTLEYSQTEFDKAGTNAEDFNTIVAQLQVRF